ncbi:hypothetical protein XENOCAPTIV_030861 [Xenoophorus captivus]|uniref:Uncharacterized protein n=1 Tax=Xenoophorus captivus TaxID=1517983 RepID=A0ABV0QFG6_9TELE
MSGLLPYRQAVSTAMRSSSESAQEVNIEVDMTGADGIDRGWATTEEKTQHCPYFTGIALEEWYFLRISTLLLHAAGETPSEYFPDQFPTRTP